MATATAVPVVRFQSPNPARRRLPTLPRTPRVQPAQEIDKGNDADAKIDPHRANAFGAVLPPALNTALSDPISFLALEEWQKTHSENPRRKGFESRVLACEARYRKVEELMKKLPPPNTVVTAVVYDLLGKVLETLPPPVKNVCHRLMPFLESAIYSEEPMRRADIEQLRKVVDSPVPKLPHFAIVRRQQLACESLEGQAQELQKQVDLQIEQRQTVVDFIERLHKGEKQALQNWLFQYWALTFQSRKARVKTAVSLILNTPKDILTPFLAWRVFCSKCKLECARKVCEQTDTETSKVASRITEVELENAGLQQNLQTSLDASSRLKQRCQTESNEHDRLQREWDQTQPELLLSVLAHSLELLFGMITNSARLNGLSLRQRVAGKDFSPFFAYIDEDDVEVEDWLMLWVNRALDRAKKAVQGLDKESPNITATYRTQFETIRMLEKIGDLSDDLADSASLTALYAIIRASRDGRPLSFNDLAVLDERDPEIRAELLCAELRSLAPTQLARGLLAPIEIANGTCTKLPVFLASIFLHDPLLEDLPVDSSQEEKALNMERMEKLIRKFERFAGNAAWEPMDDPTPLLHGGEEFQDLAALSTEKLLLQWANVQLQSVFHRPVENFGSDLQDGEAIGLLLSIVAPEAVEEFSEDLEERMDQIVTAAARCTDFDLLTSSVIVEGQSDMIAAFLAQLFLSRPNLAARPDSLLAMHLGLLDEVCTKCLATLQHPGDQERLIGMCQDMSAHWSEFLLAAQTVEEACKAMEGVNNRMRTFLGDTLAHRAQGRPRVMLDAKEAREFLFYTSLNPAHIQSLLNNDNAEGTSVTRTEDVLKKNFHLLREVFRHYSSPSRSGHGVGITLEGFMKLYQDCKLRSKVLAPRHLEVLYCDRLDMNSSGSERSLSPQNFVEVLLHCANLKFKAKLEHLPDQVQHMIENHLKPHACQETESLFQHMAYDRQVRRVLDSHAKELRIIFQLYATLDTSSAEAMQRAHTMNIEEFRMILTHCEMFDETFTEFAMHEIFDGIQQNAAEDDVLGSAEDDLGIDDDEELSLSEFLDGLVAVAAYKFPDPFSAFDKRVNSFMLKLFAAVQRHWSRKRISPQVDHMLNVLQKKLRA